MVFFLLFTTRYMFFATQTLPRGLVASLTVSNTSQLGVNHLLRRTKWKKYIKYSLRPPNLTQSPGLFLK